MSNGYSEKGCKVVCETEGRTEIFISRELVKYCTTALLSELRVNHSFNTIMWEQVPGAAQVC